MVVITKSKVIEFYNEYPASKEALLKWYHLTLLSNWVNYHSIKETFNSVDSIGNDRYVFNISGNRYRLVALIHFSTRTVYVRFLGTHTQYDKIDCKTI